MEIDVTEKVTSNSWLLHYQEYIRKLKEIQAGEMKLKKKLIYEERVRPKQSSLKALILAGT